MSPLVAGVSGKNAGKELLSLILVAKLKNLDILMCIVILKCYFKIFEITSDLSKCYHCLFLNVSFLRERERERERESEHEKGEGQRERNSQILKHVPVSELSAQSPTGAQAQEPVRS